MDPLPSSPRINRYGGRGHTVGGQNAKVGAPRRPSEEDSTAPSPCRILVQNFQPVTPEGKKLKRDFDASAPSRESA